MNALAQSSAAFQVETSTPLSSDAAISSLSVRQCSVRIPSLNSRRIKDLEDHLEELTSLPVGWDGYAGQPVSFGCAYFAANLIERLCIDAAPAPQLVPGADGTLQLEWHINQYDLEIDILGPYDVVASRYDHKNGQEEEIEVKTDFTKLAEWIVALGQDREPPLAGARYH